MAEARWHGEGRSEEENHGQPGEWSAQRGRQIDSLERSTSKTTSQKDTPQTQREGAGNGHPTPRHTLIKILLKERGTPYTSRQTDQVT